uniref:Protein kinase domain-containing protein n=1 Tax=Tetradesmus obliquus TaxID=3088 RepID=A0A383WMY9_TETOB|eukprot:jgi/Sobl393_1/6444/SZX78096.1
MVRAARAAAAATVQALLVLLVALAAALAATSASEQQPAAGAPASSSNTETHSSEDCAVAAAVAVANMAECKQVMPDLQAQQEAEQDKPCCLQQQQQQQQPDHGTTEEPAVQDEPDSSTAASPLLYVITSGCSFPRNSTCNARSARCSFDARSSFNTRSARGSFDARSALGSFDARGSFDLLACKSIDARSSCSSIECNSAAANALVGPGWTRVLSFSNSSSSSNTQASAAAAAADAHDVDAGQGQTDDRVKLGVLIGAGSFAKVYHARWRQQHVAVKVLHLLGRRAAEKAMAEAAVMICTRHPNVVAAHHVTMWQRARRSMGSDECGGGCASSFEQQLQRDGSPCSPASFNNACNSGSSGSSSDPFNAAAAMASFNSSSGDRSTSIIEGGWGEDELCEHGQEDGDEDVESQAWIVLELCDGTLDDAARSGKLANLESQVASLLDVAQGMAYLHGSSIVHGDLKAANVCYVKAPLGCSNSNRPGSSNGSSRLVCKVTDFTMTRQLDPGQTHASTTTLGTITHVAPEVLLSGKQTKAGDVYSFGMLIWEVLHGRSPYSDCHHEVEIMERVLVKQGRPAWDPAACTSSPQLASLAAQCWASEASQRPSFEAICAALLQLLGQARGVPQQQQQQLMKPHAGQLAPAGAEDEEDEHAGCGMAAEPQQAGSSTVSTVSTTWLEADEETDLLRELKCKNNSTAAESASTPRAAAPLAAAAGFTEMASSSSSSIVLPRWLPPRRSTSLSASSFTAAALDPLLYTIPEIPTGLVQLDAVSDGGAGCSCNGGLDALHHADQGLVKTLGRVRRLSNSSSSCAAGLEGVLGAAGGPGAAAAGAGFDGFEAEAAAAAERLQHVLRGRQAGGVLLAGAAAAAADDDDDDTRCGAGFAAQAPLLQQQVLRGRQAGGVVLAGVAGARQSRVHVRFGDFAADDPAVSWLLGQMPPQEDPAVDGIDAAEKEAGDVRGQGRVGGKSGQGLCRSAAKQAKQPVYASAGPASGYHSGYW